MPSIINANTSGGLISTGDTSGQLQLQTGGTTAVTINSSQQVLFNTTTNTFSAYGAFSEFRKDQNSASYVTIQNQSSGASGSAGLLLTAYGNSWVNSMGSNANNTNALTWALDATSPSEKMRLDSSGNLGLGTTPSAWTAYTALQIGNGSVANYSGSGDFNLISNGYFNTGVFKYITSGLKSSKLQIANGAHQFFISTDGTQTAGATISYTQAMVLDNSGNLLVGTSSGSNRITVSAASGTTAVVGVSNTTSGNAAGYSSSLQTAANNTSSYHYFGSTLAVGNWYLYGNGTSSWSSDERLKHNIQATRDGYLEDVCKLRVVKYQWKNGPQQTELGLIAQEVEQVFPGLVQDDLNPVHPDDPTLYKQLKGSVLPMILLKAIQELSTQLTELKAEVATLRGA